MEHPLSYQLNTRCWLRELSAQHGRAVTLAAVPDEEFAAWRRYGFTHLWLMGVWTTGPRARAVALREPSLRAAYDQVLPGWTEDDVAGSPYSIAAYEVPAALGGDAALDAFRTRLAEQGMKLILDFVPNHVGLDHPWVRTRPELFVQSPQPADGTFAQRTAKDECWIAHGKDPYFAPWTDVAQLDYRRQATRAAMLEQLLAVAARCDGVRCDMAMLLLNDVFPKTWAHLPTPAPTPAREFWDEAISAVKQRHPAFTFLAEVYWGLEATLQSLGFDYTYDKQLYDDLMSRNHVWSQRRLLEAPERFVAASVHFLENHDEPRVAGKLSPPEHRAAALTILGLPGMRLLHNGQLTGAKLHVPVQLGRCPREPVDDAVADIYETLLPEQRRSAVGRGQGRILRPRAAWPGNPTDRNFLLVQWLAPDGRFDLVAVNFAPHRSQCYAPIAFDGVAERHWTMTDLLGTERYKRVGSDFAAQGVYLDLPPHGAQVFHFEPAL